MTRGTYKLNYNLAHLTWLKVGGAADILFKPEDLEDLRGFLKQNASILPVAVLGAGSNVIIRDSGVEGIVIKLGRGFTDIKFLEDGEMSVGAACLNFNLAKFALNNSITGLEFLVGIPGTVGGGVAMNAGAYGNEFKDIVTQVQAVDKKGKVHEIDAKDITFIYRGNDLPKDWVITRVSFKAEKGNIDLIKAKMDEINKSRFETQPITEKTGGSTFANPIGYKAWQLIDEAGLRGKSIGGASMSEKHCNFMINNGGATASDMEELGEFIRKKVRENSGVELEWEIKRLGRKDGAVQD